MKAQKIKTFVYVGQVLVKEKHAPTMYGHAFSDLYFQVHFYMAGTA